MKISPTSLLLAVGVACTLALPSRALLAAAHAQNSRATENTKSASQSPTNTLTKPALTQAQTALSSSTSAGAITLEIPTGDGLSNFEISTPDAPISAATRIDGAIANAQPQRTDGFELSSRVVVRIADAAGAQRIMARHKLALTQPDAKGPSLREFWIAEFPSVRLAAEGARALRADADVTEAYLDLKLPIADRALPTDPLFADQWHLVNTLRPDSDLNVEGAWNNGHTGTGVTVCILEGGWSITHPDLAPHYNAAASQPEAGFSSHGTSTAGLVASTANNGIGGVGVAYDAFLSRVYYGNLSAIAAAFAFENNLNHIKSNSWGPTDNGRLWTISSMEKAALDDAALLGRNGLGEIFVWACGNGRTSNDRADYDPYASNRHVISIGSLDSEDLVAAYSEPGASVMAVTPSSRFISGTPDRKIATTSSTNTYTTSFGGTSAAAPIAAGAIALMLDANPNLTSRDVQHILIRTARRCNPTDASWALNGAGRWTSHDFGFGAIDAAAATSLATTWTTVAPEHTWASGSIAVNLAIPDNQTAASGGGVASTLSVQHRMRVERAQIVLTAPHTAVGQLRVTLTSPAGTVSTFAVPRSDLTSGQYNGYEFTSVRPWDEFSNGTWTVTLSDEASGVTGTFSQWSLRLFGTLPECPADWNASGAVTADDIFTFLDQWFVGNADANDDGTTDANDIFFFLDEWFGSGSGC